MDEVAVTLVRKLLSAEGEALTKLQGVAAERLVFVSGESECLPWVDGVVYLGRDPRMPSILVPTTFEPDIPLDLFESLVDREFGQFSPFAVLPGKVIPYGLSKALSHEALESWLSSNQ
jgi:hypothetical protein